MKRTGLALACGLFLSGAAMADEASVPDVFGQWSFSTAPYHDGTCALTGTAFITPGEEEGQHAVELTAYEQCVMDDQPSQATQSCIGFQTGRQLSIRCEVEDVISLAAPGVVYYPDNFLLTIDSSNRMFGALYSVANATAEFTRNEGLVS